MALNMDEIGRVQTIGVMDVVDARKENKLIPMFSREYFLTYESQRLFAAVVFKALCFGCKASCSKMNQKTGVASADTAPKNIRKRKCKVK